MPVRPRIDHVSQELIMALRACHNFEQLLAVYQPSNNFDIAIGLEAKRCTHCTCMEFGYFCDWVSTCVLLEVFLSSH